MIKWIMESVDICIYTLDCCNRYTHTPSSKYVYDLIIITHILVIIMY